MASSAIGEGRLLQLTKTIWCEREHQLRATLKGCLPVKKSLERMRVEMRPTTSTQGFDHESHSVPPKIGIGYESVAPNGDKTKIISSADGGVRGLRKKPSPLEATNFANFYLACGVRKQRLGHLSSFLLATSHNVQTPKPVQLPMLD